LPVPAQQGIRFDNRQRVFPVLHPPRQQHQQPSILLRQLRAFRLAL